MNTTHTYNNPKTPQIITHKTPPQSFIEISQSALDHNIAYYKKYIGNNNKLALVIKGNGYGHGLLEVAQMSEKNKNADWLCVANLSEALFLRDQSITKPILVLGYAGLCLERAVNKSISFMVDNLEYAYALNNIGCAYSYQFNIHVKIDTGLSRLGIPAKNTSTFIQQIQKLSYLRIEGIFSHFIASDSNPTLTSEQLNLFTQTIEQLSLLNTAHIHMSNTHATTSLNYSSLFNFFRVGLGIYGISKSHASLQPVLTWKTHIASLKTVPKGSYVSYACTHKTTRTTRIALLPIGYSEGYQLRFSNKTSVVVNNKPAPLLGRVGMNMVMIDATDSTAAIGDEVTLVGSTHPIRATDLCQTADIINVREFLTGLHPNIQRIIK